MEPRIQYAKTSDGVNIAYGVVGSGSPLLITHALFEQFSLAWGMPDWGGFLKELARSHQLIMYDSRGFGLSDRHVDDMSLEPRLRDIEAVMGAARIERPAVFGAFLGGAAAIAYTARNQGAVSRLVLYGSSSRAADSLPDEQAEALVAFCRSNWDLAAQILADTTTRQEYPEAALAVADHWRQSTTGEIVAKRLQQRHLTDVTGLLSEVRVPTLVVHRRGDPTFPLGQRLAAQIPEARFVPLEGTVNAYWLGDSASVLAAIREFLGSGPVAASAGLQAFRTVLFTDLVGHTEMMSRLGDERGRDVLREHERITREVLKANGGTEVKTMGDGFMASFGSVTKAVECAIALQRAFADHKGESLNVRVGLNAGEPIEEDGDLFGATVILASRIAARADGGEILVADTVRGLCSGKGFLFADRGNFVAKGIEEPVRISEVNWRASSQMA